MSKALLFSGQGSQYVGMGEDLYNEFGSFKEVLDRANEILDRDLKKIMFEGPKDVLTDTRNAQPALLTMDYGIYKILEDKIDLGNISYTAGHSLGEYGALVASKAFSFEDGLKIVQRRGELMSRAGEKAPGTMAAVIGMKDVEKLEKICEKNDVDMANYNSPLQIVISGSVDNVKKAMEDCSSEGAKKVVELNVSGAFHSRLMVESGEKLAETINKAKFEKPKIPVVMNVIARATTDPDEIKDSLIKQVSSPVKWAQSIQFMIEHDVHEYIECGPKRVLTGLVRRIDRDTTVYSTDNIRGVKKVMEVLS
ncbi:MAG: ACP S-malonyltransferase [Candidatus Mcinerneyibacterium aminivorans]|uniref:Malonyl CoA-acyl carrier protein transacylase n=1 Tax=Candidatus Mcinerneyibacterium aminivorans TaxID=2703815 RepID=A0A5D0MK92_9BACT|nr:MAG: ACP S-malonyltransferase [Candidatus Mcinerneyibacterium aminivorans]